MNKDALEQAKKLVLSSGEKTRAIMVAEMTHDGNISFSFSGSDSDVLYLNQLVLVNLQKRMATNLNIVVENRDN